MANEKEFYKSLLHSPGGENMGGFKNRLLFFAAHLFATIPTLIDKDKAKTLEDLATADGAFEPTIEGLEPMAIYATDKTVGMKAEPQGELDGKSYNITGEFFHPGTKTEIAAAARILNNTPGYLVLESPEGEQFIVGQKGLPCYVIPGFDGGTARADRRGFPFTFEADSYVPLIKLKSKIDMDKYFNPVTEP